MRTFRMLTSVIAISTAATQPAWAQQLPGAGPATTEQRNTDINGTPDPSSSPDRTADPSTASDQGIPGDAISTGDIVVTATRTSTLASKTPVALTAVTGDSLIETGVTNPTQIGEVVPNISIDRNNGLQITIRGVTSTDGTEKGDPSAAFMLDGIYIARSQAQETSFFDVARVEVLRGPQGTLFGRNTTAGLVNVITNRPTFTFGGRADVTYGNFGQVQTTGVVNLPITKTFAVRAAVNYDRRDNFITNGARLTRDLDPFKKNISGRVTALWDLGPGEIIVRGDYAHIGGNAPNGVLTSNFYSGFGTGQTPLYIGNDRSSKDLRRLNVPITSDLDRDNSTWGVQGEFTYDFGPIGVAYLGSYREFKRRENGVSILGSGAAAIRNRFDGDYWQNSQELRVYTNGDGPLKAQAGLYYFKEKSGISFNLFGLLAPNPGTVGYVFGFPQDPTIAKSYAGFGQLTWRVVEGVRLTGGVRYSNDDKSRVGATIRCGSVACTGPGDVVTRNIAQRTFDKVTWRAGVDVDLDPRTLLFGTISTGYKAGGFNDGCLATTAGCNNPLPEAALFYNPETITSYEAGIKTRLLNNAIRLNLTAFHYDYSGIQLSQVSDICGGPCSVTTNAAEADVTGFELETTVQPVKSSLFNIALSYLDAEYADFQVTPAVSFTGRKLDRSPGLSVIAGYTHTIELPGGGNIEANVRTRVSDSYMLSALATLNQFRVPGSTRSDASLTFNAPSDRFYVQGFVKNIEDAVVVTTVATGTFATANFADPRTYGVRAGVKF